jgi:capsular exopolysaccharide synthesis family protein
MGDSRAIQRFGADVPARTTPTASITTPHGQAIIQVIDLGGGGGPIQPYQAQPKRGGIHILSAILRRWWLVLLVTVVVGSGGFILANKFILPKYEATATVRYSVTPPPGVVMSADPNTIVRSTVATITGEKMCLLAAEDPDLRQALVWIQKYNLAEPAGRKEVVFRLKGTVEAYDDPHNGVVYVYCEYTDAVGSAALANGFANALVRHVLKSLSSQKTADVRAMEEKAAEALAVSTKLREERIRLLSESDIEAIQARHAMLIKQMGELDGKRADAVMKQMTALAQLAKFKTGMEDRTKEGPAWRIERRKLLELELGKDSLYQASVTEHAAAFNAVQTALQTMTEEHPTVKREKERMARAQEMVNRRMSEITQIVDQKITQELQDKQLLTVEQLEQEAKTTEEFLKQCEVRRQDMDKQRAEVVKVQVAVQAIDQKIAAADEQHKSAWQALMGLLRGGTGQMNALMSVEDPAFVPREPSTDKRSKVQMAGCAGGLFLGILLALLVDKFDKRLRDPRDVEPMLGAPVLGMIPRIDELKRVKGEQAKSLIAEEFRVIRTQLLFGNPELQYRTLCVTSPAPGDGKTSLAVNLAISIAKAGRRTLLIDGDMRKPDIHRVFSIPDSPGFSDLIQGACDPGAAIRRSDIELLDVMPAGTGGIRPSELLSRPQTTQIIAALAELYDHIVFDSAPLLPVSDTHVLVGMVDGVMCSFNAEVDRDTVRMVDEILRRSHGKLVGTVMNQVKYRKSTTYHRGKSAYDSYYNSPRATGTGPAKGPGGGTPA